MLLQGRSSWLCAVALLVAACAPATQAYTDPNNCEYFPSFTFLVIPAVQIDRACGRWSDHRGCQLLQLPAAVQQVADVLDRGLCR